MLHYLKYLWNAGGISHTDNHSRLLIYVYHVQTSKRVKQAFKDMDTATVAMDPLGTTSKTQSLDVQINKKFKAVVDQLLTKYMGKNMESFLNGTITSDYCSRNG